MEINKNQNAWENFRQKTVLNGVCWNVSTKYIFYFYQEQKLHMKSTIAHENGKLRKNDRTRKVKHVTMRSGTANLKIGYKMQ